MVHNTKPSSFSYCKSLADDINYRPWHKWGINWLLNLNWHQHMLCKKLRIKSNCDIILSSDILLRNRVHLWLHFYILCNSFTYIKETHLILIEWAIISNTYIIMKWRHICYNKKFLRSWFQFHEISVVYIKILLQICAISWKFCLYIE